MTASTWAGMNRDSGRTITDAEHLAQSVGDILTTPLNSRVMRRDYGSAIPALLDQPRNEVTRLRLMAAATLALWKWEPRIMLSAVTVDYDSGAGATMTLHGRRSDNGAAFSTDILLR